MNKRLIVTYDDGRKRRRIYNLDDVTAHGHDDAIRSVYYVDHSWGRDEFRRWLSAIVEDLGPDGWGVPNADSQPYVSRHAPRRR